MSEDLKDLKEPLYREVEFPLCSRAPVRGCPGQRGYCLQQKGGTASAANASSNLGPVHDVYSNSTDLTFLLVDNVQRCTTFVRKVKPTKSRDVLENSRLLPKKISFFFVRARLETEQFIVTCLAGLLHR